MAVILHEQTEQVATEPTPQTDHDSPWKEALEKRFAEFLELLFPEIYCEIDWSRGRDSLDKELLKITKDAELGHRYADKLIKVWSKTGEERYVLVHVEVQGDYEADYGKRMYTYNHRIGDRYQADVVSIAVLADTNKSFRPSSYSHKRWGCELDFRFPMVKLLDWNTPEGWSRLEQSNNIFSLVVMAQLVSKTGPDADTKMTQKIRLLRMLSTGGYSREIIVELLAIIDWMIQLPPQQEKELLETIQRLEEEQQMPYVTSFERIGIEKGMQQGMQQGEASMLLRLVGRKYGQNAAEIYRHEIEKADPSALLKWSERILTAETPEEIFH